MASAGFSWLGLGNLEAFILIAGDLSLRDLLLVIPAGTIGPIPLIAVGK